ncbi:MAG: hypothetical protein WAM95_00035 [Bacillus sp. (in: firmicutes)]
MQLFQFDYLLVVEKTLEIICGILLLANRYVSLVLAILAPLIANIFLMHVFVDHSLLVLAIILAIAYGFLLYHYRMNFRKVETGVSSFFELALFVFEMFGKEGK